jgi:hypothetical protein
MHLFVISVFPTKMLINKNFTPSVPCKNGTVKTPFEASIQADLGSLREFLVTEPHRAVGSGYRAETPLPSVTVQMSSIAGTDTDSFAPLGQSISILSIFVAEPRPK